jgi:signal transduction histidine kinase
MSSAIDILLVDDEPRNLEALEAILEGPGYRLLRATDADQALRLLMAHDVAAMVLDIRMPDMNGLELARLIKSTQRFRETPIVFLTAQMVDGDHVVAGYDAGAVDFLTKPFDPRVLRRKIAVFAELYRKTRELADLNEKLEERVRERTIELERSEAALRAAARQKDEFLAVLAHELRNPLVPLRTGLDFLLRRPREPPASRTLGMMTRQLHHIVRLIDDLLDVSRIARGALDLKREPAELAGLVAATVEAVRPTFERRRQELVLESQGEERYEAAVDTTRVAQILTNLLTNASKFTPEHGRTTVKLGRQGDALSIQVTDTGAGIPTDQLDEVFGMFARISGPGGSPAGLGIGLALARRLAEMHGGTLAAASAGESQGSTFTLTLPLSPAIAASPTIAASPAMAAPRADGGSVATPLRIVIIEDNEDVSASLKDLLEDTGHSVWAAQTGSDGVSLVQEVRPNVVLCDLGLPHMGGLEVCQRIRALPAAVQPIIVAVTGWGREEDHRRTREAGFDHHLVKPIAVESLDQVLRSVAS